MPTLKRTPVRSEVTILAPMKRGLKEDWQILSLPQLRQLQSLPR